MVAGIIIAATASGTGKTIVAAGLMHSLARSKNVAPFKVGPHRGDSGCHGAATGYPARNLDSVMCGRALIPGLYQHGSNTADIAVVEGMNGLFDGRSTPGGSGFETAAGSTAEIATILGLPVVLVVDAHGMSQSVGAVAKGFATMDSEVRIVGVILNRVSSDQHEEVCRLAVEAQGIPVLGAIPTQDPALMTVLEADLERMAELITRHVDVSAISALATEPTVSGDWAPGAVVDKLDREVIVAMAAGHAVSFSYPEHSELLVAAGATVVEFDPLRQDLPECDGLIIPGGFPESHVELLASRTQLCEQLRRHIADGKPVHAEGPGAWWLFNTLDSDVGSGKRLAPGYREAVALGNSFMFAEGERVTGYEHPHTALGSQTGKGWTPAWGWRSGTGATVREGLERSMIHASLLQTHPAAVPGAISRFVAACR